MLTYLSDPQIVTSLHTEYLNLVNYYQNIVKTSTIIKYFNINLLNSTSEEHSNSTYDLYSNSDIKFDIYDLTPVYNLNPIINRTNFVDDMDGVMLEGSSSIVTYTIQRPRIHDLITFYSPVKSEEIMRVTNFSVPSNILHSDPSVPWYELELEYAPIKTLTNLKINKHFVYDNSTENYLIYDEYIKYINDLNIYEQLLKQFYEFYNNIQDLYVADLYYIPIISNEIIILFKKKFKTKYKRLFEYTKYPYGYLDVINERYYNNLDEINFDTNSYKIYNKVNNSIEEYFWRDLNISTNNIEKLLLITKELFFGLKSHGF